MESKLNRTIINSLIASMLGGTLAACGGNPATATGAQSQTSLLATTTVCYAAWSSKTADGKRIALLARQHAQARTNEDKRKGVISTCSAITDPGASCQANRCVPGNSKAPAAM